MQLQLISIVLILHCMEYTNCQHHGSRHRLHKRKFYAHSQGCQGGCQTCSVYNGCLTCKPKLFIHLERDGMRQIGTEKCCPVSYSAVLLVKLTVCVSCPADCDSCQNSDTCTRCALGHYLLHGQCHHVCPDEFEPNDLMECIPTVHCEVGEWSEWGPCSHSGKTCGFKWGEETRIRKVLQNPSPMGSPCPTTSDKRECFVKRRRCKEREQRKIKGDGDLHVNFSDSKEQLYGLISLSHKFNSKTHTHKTCQMSLCTKSSVGNILKNHRHIYDADIFQEDNDLLRCQS
uniref:R-spondin 3 n=1 Tax=Sinocyclocheilus anshuiensis TaxID=1608454 RepID=A0A671Q7Q0_9TELE